MDSTRLNDKKEKNGSRGSNVGIQINESEAVTDIIGLFNFYLVISALSYTHTVEFVIWGDNKGTIARDVVLFCRQHKLMYTFINQKISLKIVIRNNDIFFQNIQETCDCRIPYIFYTILLNSGISKWVITNKFYIDKKQIELNISSDDFELITPLRKQKTKNRVLFDSRVEGIIFRTLQQIIPRNWKLLREPTPIILNKTIMVPDFSVEYDKKKRVY